MFTSLGANDKVVEAVHAYGGLVFHDVINIRHARKAVEAGVDGIIAVCSGAGGHASTLSAFALVPEIRQIFAGTIILGGALSTGRHIAVARMLGADLAYIGTRFLATRECLAPEAQKEMICASQASDIMYTPAISGVDGNFLRDSIRAAGIDPDDFAKSLNILGMAGLEQNTGNSIVIDYVTGYQTKGNASTKEWGRLLHALEDTLLAKDKDDNTETSKSTTIRQHVGNPSNQIARQQEC